MTSTAVKNLTRAGVEGAETLEFPPFPRPQVVITIEGRYGDWPVSIEYTGKLEALHIAIERLGACGVTPATPTIAPVLPTRPAKRRKAEPPSYNTQGEPCCPLHGRALRSPNQWGKLYCTTKEHDEYCRYTIAASDA